MDSIAIMRRLSLVMVIAGTCSNIAHANSVSGMVRLSSPPTSPVENARITLFTPTLSFFAETRTNALGAFTFEDVQPGSFRLGCAAFGLEYMETEITLGTGPQQSDFNLAPESHPGQWDIIGSTAPEFLDATDIAVLLPDGNIYYCHDTTDPIHFDPVTGTKSFPSGSPTESGCMNSTVLQDGSVLMVGGQDGSDPGSFVNAVPWVKQYVPGNDTWNRLPDVQHSVGRWYPGLSRLADGSLLVMGGGTCCSAVRTDTSERFDLSSQTWTYTGSMLNPCEFPPSALLHTGEVLATWSPPQLYNPITEQWRLTGNFNQANRGWPGHSDHSIVVLQDGRVLAVGILGGTVMGEIYDPATESWSLTSNPGLLRLQSEVVQLPDGRVFVGGGETEDPTPPVPDILGIVKWSDLYDPATNAWRRVADMLEYREYHAVTLLIPDGRLVTTGGTRIKFQIGPTSADIEAFSPPYLFRGVRPEITSISTTQPQRGSVLALEVSPTTQLTSVVLMGVQTTTHWLDGGIPRRLVLSPVQSNSTVTVTLPTDPNVLPLGHYMVFAMVDDIPSDALIVNVVESTGVPVGACCSASGSCSILAQDDCENSGNSYLGNDTTCGPGGSCSISIPSVSEWGLSTMVMVVLTAGTILLGRTKKVS